MIRYENLCATLPLNLCNVWDEIAHETKTNDKILKLCNGVEFDMWKGSIAKVLVIQEIN